MSSIYTQVSKLAFEEVPQDLSASIYTPPIQGFLFLRQPRFSIEPTDGQFIAMPKS